MDSLQRGFDILTKEERLSAVNGIISHFKSERDEDLGIIAAEDILDFFIQNVAPHIYNKALDDAQSVVEKELEECGFKIDEIRK